MKNTARFLCSLFLYLLAISCFGPSAQSFAADSNWLYPSYNSIDQYYGPKGYEMRQMSPQELRGYLNKLLNMPHLRSPSKSDELVENCHNKTDGNCFPVRSLSYTEVREYLFGHVYLEKDKDGRFYVAPIYCNQKIKEGVGPYTIPSIALSGLNTEHVFPKAHFKRSRNGNRYGEMKTDIHHLAPALMKVNSFRGSFHFGYPNSNLSSVDGCSESVRGKGAARGGSQTVFLPRPEVRGDIARMIFYFAVRFDVAIQNVEEGMLRSWHEADPVTDKEKRTNNLKYAVQGNRNPFVDYPDLVKSVSDF